MKIIGISGSPQKDGNTEQMLAAALQIARDRGFDTDVVHLSGLDVSACISCGLCRNEKRCTIDDDMTDIYQRLEDADGIIVASPVYFGGMTGQLKCFLDRTLVLRRNGFLMKDFVGGAMAVGGSRNGGQEKTVQTIHDWMHIHGMIVVGDGAHFGGIVHQPAKDDTVGLETVVATATKMCDVLEYMS